MKKQFFLSLLFCAATSLSAQTDLTERIVNPSFENDKTGWNFRKIGLQSNNDFSLKDGTYYVESWSGWGGQAPDGRVEQTLTGLPAGTYTLTVTAQNIQQGDPNVTQTGAWVYANDARTEVGLPGDYKVSTTTVDGTLDIGFTIEGATGNYVCVDNFRLTLEEPDEETYAIFRTALDGLLQAAHEIDRDLSTPEQTALDAAVEAAERLIAQSSYEGIIEVYTELDEAILQYRISVASPDNPLDMTSNYMKNPSFENSVADWVVEGSFASQSNTSFGLKVGSYYCEIWGSIPDSDIRQTVEGLPNGNYRLTAVAQNIQESNPNATQTGAYLYGNDVRTEVNKSGTYSVDFVVVDNVARVGYATEGCTGNYVCVDDFHLYYIGYDGDAQKETFQLLITRGEELMALHQHADSLAALTTAVKEAKEAMEGGDYADYAAALNKAISASETSIAEYQIFNDAIAAAEKVCGEAGSNGIDEFMETISEAKRLYEESLITLDSINQVAKLLTHAEVLYYVANASGTVPTVVTSSFIPRGVTGALGRVTVSGVPVSDIKLQGYCWATHKEPTLADNFVTEGAQVLNYPGLIYIMEPLTSATVYYVRAFAMTKTNAVGYGEVRKIITLPRRSDCTWSYAYNGEVSDNERISAACASAMDYYNNWTSIHNYGISVSFDPGDASAHCSYGGWMTIGPNAGYQRTGTVMHESNHGVGVGQHWRWGWEELKASTPWQGLHPTEMPEISGGIWWQGDQANLVVEFLTNGNDLCNGDGTHMGPFGINGAGADNGTRLLYIANALQTQGLGEDGLPPSGGAPTPYYTFESEDTIKYYLTCENQDAERSNAYLTEDESGVLSYKTVSSVKELTDNDAYAWYLIFQPQTCYYYLRNAKSGKYFTFSSGTIKTEEVEEPGETESFHLMRGRVPVHLTAGDQVLNTKGYWICEGKYNLETPPALKAGENGELVTVSAQDFSNAATDQRWVILTADEIGIFEEGMKARQLDELAEIIAQIREMAATPHTEDVSGADLTLEASLDDVWERAQSAKANEVHTFIAEARAAGMEFLGNVTPADVAEPFELNFLMNNPGIDDNKGWSEQPGFNYSCCEYWQTTFDFNQTIEDMPAGTYKLTAQAFQRPGDYAAVYRDYQNGINDVNSLLYINNQSVKVKHIASEAKKRALSDDDVKVTGPDAYLPNSMEGASIYFQRRYYDNELIATIDEDHTDLKLGIKCGYAPGNYWTIFDNFNLYYYGSMTKDEVTDIQAVEAGADDAEGNESTAVYNLQGIKVGDSLKGLPKGIYIVNHKKVILR